MRVRVYLDGFNFYYGIACAYDFKWIDIEALLRRLIGKKIPEHTIEKIILFSSEVLGEEALKRQQHYFTALKEHSSCIEVYLGKFHVRDKTGVLVGRGSPSGKFTVSAAEGKKETDVNITVCLEKLQVSASGETGKVVVRGSPGSKVRVQVREEKETDVNIACRIVEDAFTAASKEFDIACLVSNDGDLSEALKVKQRLHQRTLLILPLADISEDHKPSYPSKSLKELIRKEDRIFSISRKDVVSSALPSIVAGLGPPQSSGWEINS